MKLIANAKLIKIVRYFACLHSKPVLLTVLASVHQVSTDYAGFLKFGMKMNAPVGRFRLIITDPSSFI